MEFELGAGVKAIHLVEEQLRLMWPANECFMEAKMAAVVARKVVSAGVMGSREFPLGVAPAK